MLPTLHIESFWLAIATHLWQTTLVLLPLFLLGWTLRRAPAAVQNKLWWLALAKFFLPLSILGSVGRGALMPTIKVIGTDTSGSAGLFRLWEHASVFLNPVTVESGRQQASLLHGVLLLLTVLWLACVIWMGMRWLGQAIRRGTPGAPMNLVDMHLRRRLQAALRPTRIPATAIRVTHQSTMPSVVGLLRPKILVPETLIRELPPLELRGILLHEDAHRRRFDPLRDMIQRVAILTFFYYPLLWPLLKRLRATREMACDEAAIRNGVAASTYGDALARTLRFGLQLSGLPAAGGPGDSSLAHRLRHLGQHGRLQTMLKHRLVLILCAILVVVGSFFPLSPLAEPTDESELTMPEVIHRVLPEYPDDARKAGVQGMVLLTVIVEKDGTVGEITVEEEAEEVRSLTESAIEAMRQWKFEPATDDGEPVEITIRVPFQFKLEDKDKPKDKDKPTDRDTSEGKDTSDDKGKPEDKDKSKDEG